MKIQGIMRGIITFSGLLLIWELFVLITGVPPFLLPSPTQVAIVLWERSDYLLGHAAITAAEIALGLLLGTILGSFRDRIINPNVMAKISIENGMAIR